MKNYPLQSLFIIYSFIVCTNNSKKLVKLLIEYSQLKMDDLELNIYKNIMIDSIHFYQLFYNNGTEIFYKISF